MYTHTHIFIYIYVYIYILYINTLFMHTQANTYIVYKYGEYNYVLL